MAGEPRFEIGNRALNLGRRLQAALDEAETDDGIGAVVFTGAEGIFCAGGDIQQIYEAGIAGDYSVARTFWRGVKTLTESSAWNWVQTTTSSSPSRPANS